MSPISRRACAPFLLTMFALSACADPAPSSPSPTPDQGTADQGRADLTTSDMSPQTDMGSQDMAPLDQGTDAAPDMPPTPSCPSPEGLPEGSVATHTGPISGKLDGQIWSFLGVPFAAPPTGERRFAPPQDPECWGPQVKPTIAMPPACPQLEGRQLVGDEDCLQLNVWTRQGYSPQDKKPVMVFIHGGGNIVGASGNALPGGAVLADGANIVEAHDVIAITIQYRLGPLGFLTTQALDDASPDKRSGNYAHLDQIKALQWIKANVANFGGDPNNVMIFGESAGAINTCTMLASPLARGLFHSALMQSGACVSTPLDLAQSNSERAINETPCKGAQDQVACLRSLDVKTLIESIPVDIGLLTTTTAGDSFSFGPTLDNYVLTKPPLEAIASGQHNHVPFVIGSNADEMASENIFRLNVETAQQYEATVRRYTESIKQGASAQVLAAYPVEDYPTPQDALIQVFTDATFTCTAQRIAQIASENQQEPVYRYFFNRRAEATQGPRPASHGIELLYIFGTLNNIPLYRPAAEDTALSSLIMRSWVNLASQGDPSVTTPALSWQPYDPARQNTLVFDATSAQQDGVRADKCAMWFEILGTN